MNLYLDTASAAGAGHRYYANRQTHISAIQVMRLFYAFLKGSRRARKPPPGHPVSWLPALLIALALLERASVEVSSLIRTLSNVNWIPGFDDHCRGVDPLRVPIFNTSLLFCSREAGVTAKTGQFGAVKFIGSTHLDRQ